MRMCVCVCVCVCVVGGVTGEGTGVVREREDNMLSVLQSIVDTVTSFLKIHSSLVSAQSQSLHLLLFFSSPDYPQVQYSYITVLVIF